MKIQTSLTILFGIIAIVGIILILPGTTTGEVSRRTVTVVNVLPFCPEGCAYGSVMSLNTNSGFTTISKEDLKFECRAPEIDGCLRTGQILYPSYFKGKPINGILTCVEHHWKLTPGLAPPCPPKLGI